MAVAPRSRSPNAVRAALAAGDRPVRTATRAKPAKRASIAGVLDPIITMDEEGLIRSASDSVEQVFGWTPAELYGRNVKILIPEPRRSSLDRYLDRYRDASKTEILKRAHLFDAVRKDGSRFRIELSMSRAELPIHSRPFFIGIVRDVSSNIGVGEDSSQERTRLHELILEQTRALATAHLRLQLADRMAALGTLAAGLGHDLNNVLLPVRARLDAMERAETVATAREHTAALRSLVTYLQDLSDGLHALTLDPDGQGSAHDGGGVTDLAKWWAHVGSLLSKAVPKGVMLTASIPEGLPLVGIASQWLTQATLNLIVNAGEAIPATQRKGQIRIWADTTRGGRTVRLGVTDNGSGMTREVQRRALDLFFTTKPRSMGTGLGLPITRKVAIRAGGDLVVTSHVGKGTTVLLEVPAIKGDARPDRGMGVQPKTAMVSVVNHRIATLIEQVLLGAGLELAQSRASGPANAGMWVTGPSMKAVALARQWRRRQPEGALVVVGTLSPRANRQWSALGASEISVVDDLAALRQSLGSAMSKARVIQ